MPFEIQSKRNRLCLSCGSQAREEHGALVLLSRAAGRTRPRLARLESGYPALGNNRDVFKSCNKRVKGFARKSPPGDSLGRDKRVCKVIRAPGRLRTPLTLCLFKLRISPETTNSALWTRWTAKSSELAWSNLRRGKGAAQVHAGTSVWAASHTDGQLCRNNPCSPCLHFMV